MLPADCQLIRSDRRSLSLKLLPDGSLQLRAPKRLALSLIEQWFVSQHDWLQRARQIQAQRPPRPVYPVGVGLVVPYLGQALILRVGPHNRLTPTELYLKLRQQDEASCTLALRRWYKTQAEMLVAEVLARLLRLPAAAGLEPRGVKFRWMQRRWGSCSKDGWLTLNLELLKYPLECLELVLSHELSHLRYFNHGPEFKRLWLSLCPQQLQWQPRLSQGPLGLAPLMPIDFDADGHL